MQGSEVFFQAVSELGWISPSKIPGHLRSPETWESFESCLLTRLWESNQSRGSLLSAEGMKGLGFLIQAGARLTDHWPSAACETIERWCGKRFFLSHANNFPPLLKCSTIACSRIGRGGSQLPQWPSLLDWSLRMLRRDQFSVLVVAKTTLYQPTVAYAGIAQLPCIEVVLPASTYQQRSVHPAEAAVVQWLKEQLAKIVKEKRESNWRTCILVSPKVACSHAESDLDLYPIQDRFALALADRVHVLSARPKGKLFGLIQRRLADSVFMPGSVFVACPQLADRPMRNQLPQKDEPSDRSTSSADQAVLSRLMEQGAVGWLVLNPQSSKTVSGLFPCQRKSTVNTHQVCMAADFLQQRTSQPWDYLVHCTRGWSGALPQESEVGYLIRLWREGKISAAEPLLTLMKILEEGCLRGTTWLTRGLQASVSLTELPLQEVLRRRTYRSHVGRWDWEPYGLLFRRRHLPHARPVIYAAASEYQRMTPDDRPYFQPLDSKVDWSWEKEWRVLGDVNLREIPSNAVTVFVRNRSEAEQISRVSPFSVVWIESG
jgi:hypothetical protein